MIENLSPSRAKTYMQCPKRFHYESVLKLPTPETVATAKGKVVHYVLDYLFDFKKSERDITRAVGLVDIVWDIITDQNKPLLECSQEEIGIRKKFGFYSESSVEKVILDEDTKKYQTLFDKNSSREVAFLLEAKECIKGYFNMENPKVFTPYERELYVKAKIAGVSLHGIIDRLDKIVGRNGEVEWVVSDYKTGKPPKESYRADAFFQLEVYALILSVVMGVTVSRLRLLYIREGSRDFILEQVVTEKTFDRTKKKLKKVWLDIKQSFNDDKWPANKSVLCDWCHFKSVCPAFVKIEASWLDLENSSV